MPLEGHLIFSAYVKGHIRSLGRLTEVSINVEQTGMAGVIAVVLAAGGGDVCCCFDSTVHAWTVEVYLEAMKPPIRPGNAGNHDLSIHTVHPAFLSLRVCETFVFAFYEVH